jgi:hypothetical protein
MGNANPSGAQDGALVLARFREADAAYEAAPDAERPSLFARRHAALMLVLGTHPNSHDEICDVMRIALDELTKDLLHEGPVPRAVANALANCLQALEDRGAPSLHRVGAPFELHGYDSAPSEPIVDLDTGAAKLDSLAGLLAYLANSSGGRDVQAVFLALLTNVETIRDLISGATERMLGAAPEKVITD